LRELKFPGATKVFSAEGSSGQLRGISDDPAVHLYQRTKQRRPALGRSSLLPFLNSIDQSGIAIAAAKSIISFGNRFDVRWARHDPEGICIRAFCIAQRIVCPQPGKRLLYLTARMRLWVCEDFRNGHWNILRS